MNWDHPDHKDFKTLRDFDPTVPSWETARPLVQKQIDGHPLTQAERIYLERFYASSVSQEFFCRLKIKFAANPHCWLDGVPSEDQCSRCALNYISRQTLEYAHSDQNIIGPDFTSVNLYSYRDEQDFTRFAWRVTKDKTFSKGLVGEYVPGIEPNLETPLEKIFPVCLPGLSPQFDNQCDKNCSKCPAHGYYDSVKGITVTGLGTVKLSNSKLPQKVVEKLNKTVQPPVFDDKDTGESTT